MAFLHLWEEMNFMGFRAKNEIIYSRVYGKTKREFADKCECAVILCHGCASNSNERHEKGDKILHLNLLISVLF